MNKLLTNTLTVVLFFCFFHFAKAQQAGANISFNNKDHDFGKIKEEDGPVTYKFDFVNTGSSPLIINKVEASCGCTTPDYTKAPVPPAGTGFVSATFNPKNRPGSFTKNITITSNSEPAVMVLTIKGEVISRPLANDESNYFFKIGELSTSINNLSFSKIDYRTSKTKSFNVLNSSNNVLNITFVNTPGYLKIKAIPETLSPNAKGKIEVTYNAIAKKDWGYSSDKVPVTINGKSNPEAYFKVTADVFEDYSKLSPQEISNAAQVQFTETSFDFGSVKQGSNVVHEFVFKNNGKNNLVIRKINPDCGCTTAGSKVKIIPAGQSSSINATFNTTGKVGEETRAITVTTNDPKNSIVVLWLKGTVTK